MTDFLLLLVLTSLWIFGFRTLFQEDMILEKLGNKLWGESLQYAADEKYHPTGGWLPVWFCKMLFQCPPCMASVHGSYSFFLLFDHHGISIIDTTGLWIAFCICLCGLNYLIMKAILEPRDVTNHY